MNARIATLVGFAGVLLAGAGPCPARPSAERPGGQAVPGARLELTIGSAGKSRDEEFARPVDVKVSGAGDIYVLDIADAVVKVFDSTGKFVRRFGKKGQGPGEFQQPTSLVMGDREVTVQQRGGWKESRFALDGKHLRTEVLGSARWVLRSYPVRGGGVIVERTPEVFFSTVPAPLWRTVTFENVNPRRIDTLFRIRSDTVFVRRVGFEPFSPSSSVFGASGAWALLGDTLLAYADGYSGAATWYSFGERGATVIRRDTLGRAGQRVTAQDVANEAERVRSITGVTASVSDGVVTARSTGPMQIMTPPTHRSVVTKALLTPEGTLWVGNPRFISRRERNVSHAPFTWTAFPPGGAAFSVQLPAAFTLTAVRGNRLYGYGLSPDDEPVVLVYAVDKP